MEEICFKRARHMVGFRRLDVGFHRDEPMGIATGVHNFSIFGSVLRILGDESLPTFEVKYKK